MTDKKQPEALRLADWVESVVGGPHAKQCAAELRRLHAENTTLQAGYAAARLEIESLRAAQPAGAPQPSPASQVDRADAVNLARNTLTQYDRAITKKGVRVLAEAVLSMDAAINAARKQGANHD